MKLFLLAGVTVLEILSVSAFAGPGMLGTKSDMAPTTSGSPVGIMPLVQMLVALAIVAGLVKWVLPKMLGKVVKGPKNGEITVESTIGLGAGTAHIVSVRGRTLLIGVTANSMTTLAELSEHDASFDETFARAAIEVPFEVPTPAAPSDDVALALARLRRLEEK